MDIEVRAVTSYHIQADSTVAREKVQQIKEALQRDGWYGYHKGIGYIRTVKDGHQIPQFNEYRFILNKEYVSGVTLYL